MTVTALTYRTHVCERGYTVGRLMQKHRVYCAKDIFIFANKYDFESPSQIATQLKILTDKGMAEALGNGYYRLLPSFDTAIIEVGMYGNHKNAALGKLHANGMVENSFESYIVHNPVPNKGSKKDAVKAHDDFCRNNNLHNVGANLFRQRYCNMM